MTAKKIHVWEPANIVSPFTGDAVFADRIHRAKDVSLHRASCKVGGTKPFVNNNDNHSENVGSHVAVRLSTPFGNRGRISFRLTVCPSDLGVNNTRRNASSALCSRARAERNRLRIEIEF